MPMDDCDKCNLRLYCELFAFGDCYDILTSTSGEKGPTVKSHTSLTKAGASTDSTSLEYRKRPITGSRARKLSQNDVETDSDTGSRTSAVIVSGIKRFVHEHVVTSHRVCIMDRTPRAGRRT
jgi:hypothetical protein